jgi:hypothetical protein
VNHWEWKNVLPRLTAVSLMLLRNAAGELSTCEFPFHFSRMEKSHHGQTADSDSG